MPNNESTKKAEARRAAREAKSQTGEKMTTEAIDSPKTKAAPAPASNPTPAAKTPPDAAPAGTDEQSRIATSTPGIVKGATATRREQREVQKRITQLAAAQQAKRDILRHPEPAPDNYKVGDTIPLHILNQRAKQYDVEAKDEALRIAKETQAFVHDRIIGHNPRSVVGRSKKMRDAMALRERALEQAKSKG